MRGKRAKAIKKGVYGDDLSPKARKYKRNIKTGQIIDTSLRSTYQKIKKAYSCRNKKY